MSYDYVDSLNGQDRARYETKLRLIGVRECPFRLAASCWRNDPLLWPSLTNPDICNYLIFSPGKGFLDFLTFSNYKFN